MAGATDVIVRFVADTKDLNSATQNLEKTGGKIKKWAKGVGLAVGGAFALDFAKDSVAAAREAEEATKRLDAVFSSMGDTTGEASKAAQDYASSLSKQIAVEDETIMAAQAKLATFAKVSDETARQAGIFDRATAAAADLAAAGFGSMDTNATQLGKALQDPVKGLASLGRAGVTFTKAQKDQIKAMVDAGDTLGAQKLVLKAIETQVGGTAAATADGTDKMKIAFGEMQESVGGALNSIAQRLAPVVTAIADWASKNTGWVAAIGAFVAVLWAMNAALAANPIVLVVAALAALAAGLVLAYNKVGWFKTAVDAFWGALKAVYGWIRRNWPMLLAVLTGPIGMAVLLIQRNWERIKGFAASLYNTVRGWWTRMVSFIGGSVSSIARFASQIASVLGRIGSAARNMYDTVVGYMRALVRAIQNIIGGVSRAVGDIVDAIRGPLNAVIRAWNNLGIPGFTVDINLPGPVPDIHFSWDGVPLPNMPLLAKGGIVTRPTLAMLGEAGSEAVIPLDRLGAAPSGPVINVHVDARGAPDPYSVGAAIESRLRAWGGVSGKFHPGRTA